MRPFSVALLLPLFFSFLILSGKGEGIQPDVVTTTILVKAQVGSGDVDGGARTLIEMMKSTNLKDQLDAFPFNTIIKVGPFACACGPVPVNNCVRLSAASDRMPYAVTLASVRQPEKALGINLGWLPTCTWGQWRTATVMIRG